MREVEVWKEIKRDDEEEETSPQVSDSEEYTLAREAEAAGHLQAGKMVELGEVIEHHVPDQSSEANKSIHTWACRGEEEQISLKLLHSERREGEAEGDYQRESEVGATSCNVHAHKYK